MSKKLSMYFMTDQGAKSSLALDDPKNGLLDEEVRNVMQIIIDNNIFDSAKGDLVEIKSAEVVTITKEVIL